MANAQTTDAPTSIVVVDDDENTRLCFKDILQSAQNFNLSGSYSNATEALDGIPRLQPDLALMDIHLPDLNGIECTRKLRHLVPHLKIVMVTGTHERDYVSASLRAGAVAFLIKPIDGDQLLATLHYAAVSSNKASTEKAQLTGAGLTLSPREKEVMSALAEGLLYKEISQKLGISYAAVHKHQHSIFKKLRVTNRSEASRLWLDNHRAK